MNYRVLVVLITFLCTYMTRVESCGDALHANCELWWNITGAECSDVLTFFTQQFKSCCADSDIQKAYTNYSLTNVDPDNLIVSGTITFSDGYTDQQTIQLNQAGSTCNAYACSHSESLSYYDYCANFCDIHNLIRGISYSWTETMGDCRFHPDSGKQDSYCNGQ